MQSAPAYGKLFHLYITERAGLGNTILMQDPQTGKQLLAYYCTKQDNVKQGLPPWYQGLATTAFAYPKASTLTMGYPVTLYMSHQLHALLTSPRLVLNQARKKSVVIVIVMLSAPQLKIQLTKDGVASSWNTTHDFILHIDHLMLLKKHETAVL